jgi:hypothetical protein
MPDMLTVPLLQVVVFAVALAGVGEGDGDAAGTAAACVVAAAISEQNNNTITNIACWTLHLKRKSSLCNLKHMCWTHSSTAGCQDCLWRWFSPAAPAPAWHSRAKITIMTQYLLMMKAYALCECWGN